MKNLKKISRDGLKSIKGGFTPCNMDGSCDNPLFCCSNGGCRRISGASPSTYQC